MPNITLSDGSIRSYEAPITAMEVAESIGEGLARATICARLDDELRDACDLISDDCRLELITDKNPDGVDVIRHSFAHLLGHAAKQLFPEIKMAIGPVIKNGFYYDVEYSRPLVLEDLEKLSQRMIKLAKDNYQIQKRWLSRKEVKAIFQSRDEDYKLEIINSDIADNVDLISLYFHQEYIDMCRGPHVPNTRHLRHFKLTNVTGAYWRGKAENAQLQRIYGVAFASAHDLKSYEKFLLEAARRDHRVLGKTLDLFHLQEEAPGMVFWHPNGWSIFLELEKYIRFRLHEAGYQEIRTPQLVDRLLWEKSGHWEKYKENMFLTSSENRDYAVKPMNCPCHVQVFNKKINSYKDLPIRFSEFGSCHRNETSGSLHGLMRVRNFVQDDAHIFCTENQVKEEVKEFNKLLMSVYSTFGFTDVNIGISTRPERRVGSDFVWDKAELALISALDELGVCWTELPGEGAFYGPKIEYSLRDCLGRTWQCGTMQVDFSMPERLNAEYITETGARETPVLLHRAILGSLERFIGILLEDTEGRLPLWLSPCQVAVIPISDKQHDYALEIKKALESEGIRIKCDLRNEKIGYKIRHHTLQRTSYLLVAGEREVLNKTVSVRNAKGNDMGEMSLQMVTDILTEEIKTRS